MGRHSDDFDEDGVLKDGRTLRTSIYLSDHARSNLTDAELMDAAYERSVVDLNAWRNDGRPERRTGVAGTEAMQDAARDKAVADLNAWRTA
jgi:hypothetical protein